MVINYDRKIYNFPVPHINVTDFTGAENMINLINEKLGKYQEKVGKLPDTIVLDTVTQYYTAVQHYNGERYKGFDIHSNNNKDTLALNAYVEDVLIKNGINVVIVAHTIFDSETGRHIIPASGQFAKAGSWLSIVNQAIYIEKKTNKFVIHQRSMKLPCRTTLAELEDAVDEDKYDINEHIKQLAEAEVEAEEFVL